MIFLNLFFDIIQIKQEPILAQSTKTGSISTYSPHSTVETNVRVGTKNLYPFLNPLAARAKCSPAVQELSPTTFLYSNYLVSFFSKFRTCAPVVSQPFLIESLYISSKLLGSIGL